MMHLLLHHEYSDGQYWHNEQTCIDDFLEHLDRNEVFEVITCFHDEYKIIQRGLDGDTSWFQEIYDEAIDHCISEYVYTGLYTDKDIEDFIIMDEEYEYNC